MCTSVDAERNICAHRHLQATLGAPWTPRSVSGYLSYLGSAGCRTNAASSSDPVHWLRRFNAHIDSTILRRRHADSHFQNRLKVDPSRLTANLGKRAQGCLNILPTYGRSKGLVPNWKIEGAMRTSRSFVDQP